VFATATVECNSMPGGRAHTTDSPSAALDHHSAGELDLLMTDRNNASYFSAARTPAGPVGGDYLDLVPLDDRRVGICVGDATGKGAPAAILVSRLQAALRAVAPEYHSTRSVTTRINRLLCAGMATNKFITLFYGVLDGRSLTYTNAGHNAPMLVRADGGQSRLEQGGALLGVFPDWVYQQGEVLLAPGDRLVLFSDGITEAENSTGEQFGDERLLAIVAANRVLGATALRRKIISAVAAFSEGALQDDATLLVIAIE
jgi:phosphoserine phosphatase RsbU/P